MSKAVTTPLCILLLATSVPLLFGQTGPTDAAVQEAVRRQADRITLRQKLDEAGAAEQRHELAAAAKLYDAAWDLIVGIGPSVDIDPERQQTIAGLTAARMALAREAQRSGELRDAQIQVEDVLRVNPHDAGAIAFANTNRKMLDEQRGHIPSLAVQQEGAANVVSNKIAAATLVQDARVLYELRQLDEADAKVREAMKMDPGNRSAVYYGSLVEQARAREAMERRSLDTNKRLVEIEQAWEPVVK